MQTYSECFVRPVIQTPRLSGDCLIAALPDSRLLCDTTIEIQVNDTDPLRGTSTNTVLPKEAWLLTCAAVEVVKYLCPFCDQPLGPRVTEWFADLRSATTETLPRLIAALWKKSTPQPRVTNPQGRVVPPSLKAERQAVCEQHRYETLVLPLSVQYSWPRHPDFYRLIGYMFEPVVFDRIQRVFETPNFGLMIDDPNLVIKSREFNSLLEKMTRLRLLGAG